MPDPRLGEKACAYVVLVPGAHISFEALVDFLRSRGASVLQLPERLELVEELPRTPVKKTDKEALRKDIREKLEKENALRKREP
jgi:non-ribosomal peptide synthetase component E (peptide arylation enzyme)